MWSYLERILYDNTIEEEYYRKIRQKSSSNSAIIVGLVSAMGGFLYGYDTGLINDILEMKYVSDTFPGNGHSFTTHERALITAILSLGTFFGALVAPLISDNFGRKFSIILSAAVIFNAGNLFQVISQTVPLLCVGRAISGVAVGILSAIVPLYQAEASPKWVRGSVVFTYQWAITWGLLMASAVCQGTRKINNSGSFRIPVGLQFLWALILCCGMLFLPESPRYYVLKDNVPKALQSLVKLRRLPADDADLIEELVEIKANYDYEMSFGKTTLLDCFRSGGGRHKQGLRMLTGIGVHAFQQCTGINFIFYYGVNFFSSSGIKNYYIMSFVTYLVNMIFTIPGMIFIDIIGRRSLMLWGGVGMSVSNFIVAIVGVSVPSQEISSILSISFSCVFIAFYASSWGGAVWAIASDIYGISIRQKAISLTAATNWIVNFIFAYITPYLIDTGSHTAALGNKIFFIWGGLNALGVVFTYFIVYETKGLKLEEVDFMYVNCTSAPASAKFKSRKFDYTEFDDNYLAPITTIDHIVHPHRLSDDSTDHDTSNDAITPTTANASSSPSNDSHDSKDTNEKQLSSSQITYVDHTAVPHAINHEPEVAQSFAPSSINLNQNITIVPYNNTLMPSSSSESEEVSSTPSFGVHSTTVPNHQGNDYQVYLDTLKRDYSASQSSTHSPLYKMTRERSNPATNALNTASSIHLTRTNSSGRGVVSSKLFSDKLDYDFTDGPKMNTPSVIGTEPGLTSTGIVSSDSGVSGGGSGLSNITIIAKPFFDQPPDSDSPSEIEEEDESDDSDEENQINLTQRKVRK